MEVLSQREGGLSSADILRTKGDESSSVADISDFWCKKLWIFWNLWCVRTDKRGGGWAKADIFRTEGVDNFSRFCADVLYERLLIV